MTVLVVHYSGAFEDIRLARFADRAAAEAALFPERYAFVVERDDDLLGLASHTPNGQSCTLTSAGCARIYNTFADKKTGGRFTDRTIGAIRTWKLLMEIGNTLPLEQTMKRRRAGLTKARTDAPRRSKSAELDADAARGVMPSKPVVNSVTNAYRQKHFDKLHDLAESGDWDAVAAYHMKGIDTYSKSINKYRDRLLAAHVARLAAE